MATTKPSVTVSVDVETTGESPCTSSCVMIGCAVLLNSDVSVSSKDWILEKKSWCIREIDGRPPSERCWNEFWVGNTDLWEHIKKNAVDPRVAMKDFAQFYDDITSKYNCSFVAAPSSFDWQWIKCLYDEFGPVDKKPLPFSINCYSSIRRVCMELGLDRKFIEELTSHPDLKHTHYADDDALEQGYSYLRLTQWLKNNVVLKKS
jgi:hypothetical protein